MVLLAALITLAPSATCNAANGQSVRSFDNRRVADIASALGLSEHRFSDLDYGLDGSLWMRLDNDSVAQLTSSRINIYGEEHGLPKGSVSRLIVLEDGTPWVVSQGSILALENGNFIPPKGLKTEQMRGTVVDVLSDLRNICYIVTQDEQGRHALYGLFGNGTREIWLPDPSFRPTHVETGRDRSFLVSNAQSIYTTRFKSLPRETEKIFEAPENHVLSYIRTRDCSDVVLVSGPGEELMLYIDILRDPFADRYPMRLEFLNTARLGISMKGHLRVAGLNDEGKRIYDYQENALVPVTPSIPATTRNMDGMLQDAFGAYWIYGDLTLSTSVANEQMALELVADYRLISTDSDGRAWMDTGSSLVSSDGRQLNARMVTSPPSAPWALSKSGYLIALDDTDRRIDARGWEQREDWRLSEHSALVAYRQAGGKLHLRHLESSEPDTALPFPLSHNLAQIDYAESYVWVLYTQGNALNLMRWDPVLSEGLQRVVDTIDPLDPVEQHRFLIDQGQVFVWGAEGLYMSSTKMEPFQSILGEDEIKAGWALLTDKIIVPIRRDDGGELLWLYRNGEVQRLPMKHYGWDIAGVDTRDRIIWKSKDGRKIGRSLLEPGAAINPVDLSPLRLLGSRVLAGTGDQLYLEVSKTNARTSTTVRYNSQSFFPETTVEILTELRGGTEHSVIAQLHTPPADLRSHQPKSVQYSWRLSEGPWSPFASLNDRRIDLGALSDGQHELQIRVRDQDFVENPVQIRHNFEISPNPLQSSTWFTPSLLVMAATFVGLVILLAQKSYAEHQANKILKMEVQARQQAQIDLMDINEDLEKRVKLRTQEIVFANESLKKQIEERKQTESRLKETHGALLASSRQAGMAEIATGILHNVGNVLNSLNVSLEMIKNRMGREEQARGLDKLAKLVAENAADPSFLTESPKGKKIPEYLNRLSQNVRSQQQDSQAYILEMTKKVEHLKEIISAQQDYAKVAGVVESFDLEEAIDQMLKLNERGLNDDHIEVTLNTRDCPTVQAERPKLQQILLNLIQNAQWACNERSSIPSRIDIRAYFINPQTMAVEVKDNGIGIEKEDLRKIFFHGFTTRDDGHGFGLHTAINMAAEMQGKLEALSEGQNMGATFRLSLPIDPKRKSTKSDMKDWTQPKPGGRPRSLEEAMTQAASRK